MVKYLRKVHFQQCLRFLEIVFDNIQVNSIFAGNAYTVNGFSRRRQFHQTRIFALISRGNLKFLCSAKNNEYKSLTQNKGLKILYPFRLTL